MKDRHGLPKINFRLATPDDAPYIIDRYAPHYFEEAGYGAFCELDLDRAIDEIAARVKTQTASFIVADVDGVDVGFVGYLTERIFTKRPTAALWFLYVDPPYRKGPLGRMLLALAMNGAKGDGCCAFFAVVAPTSRAGRMLCNMFRRAGFASMGGGFIRRL